jgi:hypothetical protein
MGGTFRNTEMGTHLCYKERNGQIIWAALKYVGEY